MKHIYTIILVLLTTALSAQNRNTILANIEAYSVATLSNGMKIQVVKTSEYQHFTYRLTADVSAVGEGNLNGIKHVVADLTGCEFLPEDLIVKKMVSHDNALDSVFEFMAEVIYGSKYTKYQEYKQNKISILENNPDLKYQNIAAKAAGEKILTAESLRTIGDKDVESFIKQCFTPEKCILTVVANVDLATVQESAKKYFDKATKTPPKNQPNAKRPESGDYIYALDVLKPETTVAYRCNFPFAKTSKNYALGNVAYKIMFTDSLDYGYRRASLKSESYSIDTRLPIQGFDSFQAELYAPLNPNFDFGAASAKAKAKVIEEYEKMLLRPEYAAEIASHLLIYKLPKNYFTQYKQAVNNIATNDFSDFFNAIAKNGRGVMVVAGPRKTIHCQLFNAARNREVDFMTTKLEKERVIPKGFGEATILEHYLTATGLIDPPKNLIEDFESIYTFPTAGTYKCVGKIYRKYPLMYKMENYVEHRPDTLIVHYIEMFNGTIGNDSTKLFGMKQANELRNKELRQKASFPIEM
ncbi:MAG: insulinase family protein, partial [Bacteroidales bacterium]|nr:insulinase family protein [Bacteroidales bacterium]